MFGGEGEELGSVGQHVTMGVSHSTSTHEVSRTIEIYCFIFYSFKCENAQNVKQEHFISNPLCPKCLFSLMLCDYSIQSWPRYKGACMGTAGTVLKREGFYLNYRNPVYQKPV